MQNPFGGVVSQADDPQAPECGYGAFHVQWWLGDHLVALCVVDVLPRCGPFPWNSICKATDHALPLPSGQYDSVREA